jgi:hypothetical protein
MAVRTDYKTPPANPHKHDHGLTQVDAALLGKAPAAHTHPEIAALTTRVTALEAADKVLSDRISALEAKPPLPTAPPAPANLKAVAANGSVTLTWSTVA